MEESQLHEEASKKPFRRFRTVFPDLYEVLTHSKNYLIGDFAAKALFVLSLPLLTRLLTTADYGIYQVFASYVGILMIVLTLNFHGSIARYHYDSPSDYGEFVGTSIVGSFFLLGLSFSVILILGESASSFLGIPHFLLPVLFFIIGLRILYSAFYHIRVARKESVRLIRYNVIKTYLSFALGILFVILLSKDRYVGLIAGEAIVGTLLTFYIYKALKEDFRYGPAIRHIKYIFRYSVPLVPYTLSNVILGQFDRVMINNMISSSDAGIYSLAYNFGLMLSLVTGAINTALAPDWFRLMNDGRFDRVDDLVDKTFRLTILFASILVFFSSELFFVLVDSKFHVAVSIVPLIVSGYIFDAMFKIYGRNIGYTNKMLWVSLAGITGALVNVILNYLFIPKYGYIACAYSTVLSYLVILVMSWCICRFILRVNITPISVLIRPLCLFLLFAFGYYFLISFNLRFYAEFTLKLVALSLLGWLLFGPNLMRLRLSR